MSSIQWRTCETIAPRILYVKGKPMRLVLRPYGQEWNVYDITTNPPSIIARNLSHEAATALAQKPFEEKVDD